MASLRVEPPRSSPGRIPMSATWSHWRRACWRGTRGTSGAARSLPRRRRPRRGAGRRRRAPAGGRVRRRAGGSAQGGSVRRGYMAGQRSRATLVAEPVGAGRPGWHAECTAIALHAFGSSVDVQAGGGRPALPAPCVPGRAGRGADRGNAIRAGPFTVGVVRVASRRRWPIRGNLVLVADLLAKYPAAAVRLLILDRPWGQDWEYDPAELEAAAPGWTGCTPLPRGTPPGPWKPRRRGSGRHSPRTWTCPRPWPSLSAGGQAARTLNALLGLW